MTCGRIASYRNDLENAEALVAEAWGRLQLVGDTYGAVIAEAVTSGLAPG